MRWRRRRPPVLNPSALVQTGVRSLRRTLGSIGAIEAAVGPQSAPIVALFVKANCDGCTALAAGAVAGGILDGPWRIVWCLREADRAIAATLPGVAVVGDEAFTALSVTSGPFYALLGPHATLLAEGVPFGPEDLRAQLDRALAGAAPVVGHLDGSAEQV